MDRREYEKKWRDNNKEKSAAYFKKYAQTPKGIKSKRINNWKRTGLITDDIDKIYERYMNSTNCECCGKEYNSSQRDKHMDHCHKTGKFRNILCRNCNQLRGHIDKDYKLIMKLITMC